MRLLSEIGPEARLGEAIAGLPHSARAALADVADREDLPLVAGTWRSGDSGCLVANVVATRTNPEDDPPVEETLDLRILRLLPELSSRDLNRLIVAWDEAAEQEGRTSDAALRRLLRGALAWASVDAEGRAPGAAASGVTATSEAVGGARRA